LANGAAKPVRKLEGAKTLLGRTMHSIEYDALHDEFAVPIPFAGAILTFRGEASGNEAPLRIIQGSLTQIEDPSRLALDPVNNEILVPQGRKILVFPREANGNVAPVRILEGPDTKLGAGSLAVDPIHDLLIAVGGPTGGGEGGRSTQILIFDRKASGNTKPRRVIGGPKTMLTTTGGPSTIYAPTGKILVPIRGNLGTEAMFAPDSFVGVWNITDDGDVAPRWTIGGPRGAFQMVRGVAVNAKYKEVIVTDKRLNAVLTFSFPELFQ
jgi:hypothetical protein